MTMMLFGRSVALSLLLSGFSAPQNKAAGPSQRGEGASDRKTLTISDALCGRANRFKNLSSSLDRVSRDEIPRAWRQSDIRDLQKWFDSPICAGATAEEEALYKLRHGTLDLLRSLLDTVRALEGVEMSLESFGDRKPDFTEWPSTKECPSCSELLRVVRHVEEIAVQVASRVVVSRTEESRLDDRLVAFGERKALLQELCHPYVIGESIEETFKTKMRYYTWTEDGARLLDVLQRVEVFKNAGGCDSP